MVERRFEYVVERRNGTEESEFTRGENTIESSFHRGEPFLGVPVTEDDFRIGICFDEVIGEADAWGVCHCLRLNQHLVK